MKIMFICTGNICRSAMAHVMLEDKVKNNHEENIQVYSSGIYAENGDSPTYNAIEVMQEYGINLKNHRATNIKNSNIEEMNLILCATSSHKIAVLDLYPNLEDKVYTIKEYVNYDKENHNKLNISDPWGYDIETYRYCAGEIDECLEMLLKKVKEK